MLLTEEGEISPAALPLRVRAAGDSRSAGRAAGASSAPPPPGPRAFRTDRPLAEVLEKTVHEAERAYLHHLLAATGGHLAETARRAAVSPRSLYDKMRRHGLRKEDYRAASPPARTAQS